MSLDLNSATGMFLGLAIGDAMGSPIEFEKPRPRDNYIRRYQSGGFHSVSKGEFTDDTSMAFSCDANLHHHRTWSILYSASSKSYRRYCHDSYYHGH